MLSADPPSEIPDVKLAPHNGNKTIDDEVDPHADPLQKKNQQNEHADHDGCQIEDGGMPEPEQPYYEMYGTVNGKDPVDPCEYISVI